jgi:hypothetical protein
MRDGFLYYCRINREPHEITRLQRSKLFSLRNRLSQRPLETLLVDPVTPACHRERFNRQPVLNGDLPTIMLPIWVLPTTRDDRLIRKGVSLV